MKIDFRLRGGKHSAALQHLVQTQIDHLRAFVTVDAAQVVLERQRAATPAWVARAHVQVPGPDLRAEARDHTVEAAWRKVLQALYGQVGRRLDRRRHGSDAKGRLRPTTRFQ